MYFQTIEARAKTQFHIWDGPFSYPCLTLLRSSFIFLPSHTLFASPSFLFTCSVKTSQETWVTAQTFHSGMWVEPQPTLKLTHFKCNKNLCVEYNSWVIVTKSLKAKSTNSMSILVPSISASRGDTFPTSRVSDKSMWCNVFVAAFPS